MKAKEILIAKVTQSNFSGSLFMETESGWSLHKTFVRDFDGEDRFADQAALNAFLQQWGEGNTQKKIEGYLFLPRSSFFLVWRPLASGLFPHPAEKLLSKEISFQMKDSTVVLSLATLKSAVRPYQLAFNSVGINLKGVAPLFLLQAEITSSEKNLDDRIWVLSQVDRDEAEVTVFHGRVPLLSRILSGSAHLKREIAETVSSVQKTYGISGPVEFFDASRVTPFDLAKSLLSKNRFMALDDLDEPTPFEIFWSKHRHNIFAGSTVALTVCSLLMGSTVDRTRDQLERVSRDVSRFKNAKDSRHAFSDPVLSLVTDIARQVPPSAYVIDLRYDASQKAVVLRGQSKDYEQVSQFATALSKLAAIRRVHTDKSSLVRVGNRSVVEFALEVKTK